MPIDFKQYTAKDLVVNQQLKSLRADQTLADVLVQLSQHQLLALPIFDTAKNEYVGFIDVVDVVSTLLLAGLSIDFIKLLAPISGTMEEFVKSVEFPFGECVIQEIINASDRNPWKTVSENATLDEVLDLLTGLHRVAVINAENNVTGVISQFGALAFLQSKLPADALQAKLLPIPQSHPLVTITKGTTVYEAFHVLNAHKISGVPVVDADGNLVHSFSANDIKGSLSNVDVFRDIYKPVEALTELSDNYWKRPVGGDVHVASAENTVAEILSRIVTNHIHRVFVVENNRPVQVVSLGDVISAIRKL